MQGLTFQSSLIEEIVYREKKEILESCQVGQEENCQILREEINFLVPH